MPQGPFDAGNNVSKGDQAESKISGSGSSDEASLNLLADANEMPASKSSDSADKGAFGEKNDGALDTQVDVTENQHEAGDAAEQVDDASDASDNPQEINEMMKKLGEKAAQSMDKAGQKFDSLKGTDQEDNAKKVAEQMGEIIGKTGFPEIGKQVANGGFKAAGNLAKGYAESAKKD